MDTSYPYLQQPFPLFHLTSGFNMIRYITILFILTIMYSCKKPYTPPETETSNTILVVEGTIATGSTTENRFLLSRVRPLQDTSINDPESGARVTIEAQNGGNWNLQEIETGTYSASLTLSSTSKYRLSILTRNGKQYQSEYLDVTSTPPIDSVTWKQPDNLEISVHTHDPTNNTKYYRWDFKETWEYHAFYDSNLDFVNGQIVYIDPADQTYSCWSSNSSGSIIIANTTALTEDVISYQPVQLVLKPSVKASFKYSILVRQIGLTEDAYNFWNILRKNTELTGTLFDPQPSQLPGNIICVNDANEKVIGYISAGAVSEMRLYVRNAELLNWPPPIQDSVCKSLDPGPDPVSYLNADTTYGPAYYVTGGGVRLAKKPCMDCRRQGGTNIKPPFWR
jgi:Domain of unknown function (DUF4249)